MIVGLSGYGGVAVAYSPARVMTEAGYGQVYFTPANLVNYIRSYK